MRSTWTVLVLVCGLVQSTRAQTPVRPNILLILSDDVGFSDLGCYGSEINTPNLDQLAGQGLRFTQFYNTARCCPTRASLLTGLYPHQAGIGEMVAPKRTLAGYEADLAPRAVTIAQVLAPAGYRCYASGKWHISFNQKNPDGDLHNWPIQRGFERYYGIITGAANYFDPGTLCKQNQFITPWTDPDYQPEQYYLTDAISDYAARFIREHKQQSPDAPFFCYVAYTAGHWPLHARPQDIQKYAGKYDVGYEPIRRARFEKLKQLGLIGQDAELSPLDEPWPTDPAAAKWNAECMEVYAAMIDSMDQGIGRIVETLRSTGQLDNTLIFYLQDNGGCAEAFGREKHGQTYGPDAPRDRKTPTTTIATKTLRDGRPVRSGPGVTPGPEDTYVAYGKGWANVSNTPFREYKHWVHEGGISTPLIVRWPGGIRSRGELRTQPGHLIDIMATCLDVSGAQYPSQINGTAILPPEGKSLRPAFADQPIDRSNIFWEHEGNRALRVGDFKIVSKEPPARWELYNLGNDRSELHDLSTAMPGKRAELIKLWNREAARTLALPWPWKEANDQ